MNRPHRLNANKINYKSTISKIETLELNNQTIRKG